MPSGADKGITNTIYCDEHDIHIPRSKWAQHTRLPHVLPPEEHAKETKGIQEYCKECKKWFAHNQRARHFRNIVHSQPPPPSFAAKKMDPRTGQEVKRKRPIGQKSKHFFEPSLPPQPSPTAETTEQKEVEEAAKIAHWQAQEQLRQRLKQVKRRHRDMQDTRLADELPIYMEILDEVTFGHAITADRYLKLLDSEEIFDLGRHAQTFVVCSAVEASALLDVRMPVVPILIRNFAQPSLKLFEPGGFLDYLATKRNIEVHELDKPPQEGNLARPSVIPAREAVSMFKANDGRVLNFLNLSNMKANEVPWMLAKHPAYSLLRNLHNHNSTGQQEHLHMNDLTCNASFHLCATGDVFSLPHCDHLGVLTTIFAEHGEKVWYATRLDHDAEQKWVQGGELSVPLFPIYLRPGSLLIQPPGLLHAPFTLNACLMSGTMSWDSRDMLTAMRQTLMERRAPWTTNQDEPMEALIKFKMVARLWGRYDPAWPWGSQADLKQFQECLKVSFNGPFWIHPSR